MKREELPHLPHELLAVAIRDLEACETDPTIQVRMQHGWLIPHVWDILITPITRGACSVCLAGAVLVQTKKIPRDQFVGHPMDLYSSYQLEYRDARRIESLDHFRQGKLESGLELLVDCVTDAPGPVPAEELQVEAFLTHALNVVDALNRMAAVPPFEDLNAHEEGEAVTYEDDPEKFKSRMRDMVAFFERLYTSWVEKEERKNVDR